MLAYKTQFRYTERSLLTKGRCAYHSESSRDSLMRLVQLHMTRRAVVSGERARSFSQESGVQNEQHGLGKHHFVDMSDNKRSGCYLCKPCATRSVSKRWNLKTSFLHAMLPCLPYKFSFPTVRQKVCRRYRTKSTKLCQTFAKKTKKLCAASPKYVSLRQPWRAAITDIQRELFNAPPMST